MRETSRKKSKRLPSYYFRAVPQPSTGNWFNISIFNNGASKTWTLETNYPQRYWIDTIGFVQNKILKIPAGGSYEIHRTNGIITGITITGGQRTYSTSVIGANGMFAFTLKISDPSTGRTRTLTAQVNISYNSLDDLDQDLPIT